ncbi:hypothetical protein ACI65C_001741 [Semiaphis heraclei]
MCRHRCSRQRQPWTAVRRSRLSRWSFQFSAKSTVLSLSTGLQPDSAHGTPFSRARVDGACDASRPATAELCPVKVLHGPRWISRLGCALMRRQLHPGTAAPPVDNTKYCDKVT